MYCVTIDQRDTVFSALATCLSRQMEDEQEEEEEEEEQLTLSSPLEYFLEVKGKERERKGGRELG